MNNTKAVVKKKASCQTFNGALFYLIYNCFFVRTILTNQENEETICH